MMKNKESPQESDLTINQKELWNLHLVSRKNIPFSRLELKKSFPH